MIDPDLTPGTQRRARGHNFLPPRRDLNRVPALYSTEQVDLPDKMIHLHYFTGPADWYVAEIDQVTGDCFGFVRIAGHGDGEWVNFSLVELEAMPPRSTLTQTGGTLLWVVERDKWWSPTRFADIKS